MSLLSILGKQIRTNIKDQNGKTVLLVDATTSEVPTYESDITDHPVEDGTDVSDNIRPKPIMLDIEGVISSTPITLSSSLQGLTTAAGGLLGSSLGGFGSLAGAAGGAVLGGKLFSQATDPALEAYSILINLWKKKTKLTLVTGLTQYNNMVIQSISFPKDPKTGGQLRFTAKLKEIRTVSSATVTIQKTASSVKHTASPSSDLGKQSSKISSDQNQSALKGLTSWFKGGG
jgi:hypothetical protein